MYIKQLYTNCLNEAAYYIESNGEAAIVNPLRDIEEYILLAKERKATIKYIFETHFTADFVSGHIDLSNATGAPLIYGPSAKTNFAIENAIDGQIYKLGNITFKVIHTPGHTPESACYLLMDKTNKPYAIFTGDTLFARSIGRPNLSSGDMSNEELAEIMYDTLTKKILPLPDDILVYPAHDPGSSWGKNLGSNTFSTMAEEKKSNPALQPQTKEDFITAVTTVLSNAPISLAVNADINKQGYEAIDTVKTRGIQPLSIEQFKQLAKEDVVVLDTRPATEFTQGFIPGSLFIGLEGRFAEWAGSLLPFNKKLILVTPTGKEEETVIKLARVGFDKMNGVLHGGFEAWQQAGENTDMIIDIEADELMMDIPHDPNLTVVDVRREAEHADGHLKGSVNLPLNDMTDVALLAQFEEQENLYVHCASGYRSVIALSILKKEGINNVRNVLGGWAKIKDEEKAVIEKDASVLN